ncbi:MAG TPA: SH3 domain-containing protein [Pyrinomonadaceae bacterium]|nr:SH3 domain-containing protein [Pyrinomonadaceae bacterium]
MPSIRYRSILATLVVLGSVWTVCAQSSGVKLEVAQAKITTVSAMRVRSAPQATAPEIARLKLGTTVNAVARSTDQDTVGGKTDYWYQVNLANGQSGWLFGGLLLDYDAGQRQQLISRIIDARLKAENTDFSDRQEIYNLADRSLTEAKDVSSRAEFELLKLLALANWAVAFPDNQRDKSPYRQWLVAHAAEVVPNEFAGGYNMRSELLWKLEAKYHALPIADRIAWAAAENPQPHDCEGDEVCHLFVLEGAVKYLELHPSGDHAAEAVKNLNELVTDDVINRANAKDGDKYVVEERASLRKLLALLRRAVAKTSTAEKPQLLKKLERVSLPR